MHGFSDWLLPRKKARRTKPEWGLLREHRSRMGLHFPDAFFRSLTCFTCRSKGEPSIPFASGSSDWVKMSSPGVVPMCYNLLVRLENVCCSHLSTSYYRDVTYICFRRHLHQKRWALHAVTAFLILCRAPKPLLLPCLILNSFFTCISLTCVC